MKSIQPGNWHTLFWAVLYVVQIFAFAFIYSLQSSSFYHATSHLEPSIRQDEKKMALEYKNQLESKRVELRLTEDLREWPVGVFFRYDREKSIANVIIQDGGMGSISYTGRVLLGRQGDRWLVSTSFFDEKKLDEKYGQASRPPWAGLRFEPSEEFVVMYYGWEAANNGRISRLTDIWTRLFYFSVVTTTTLGYGDIVPLTPWARFWVAMQSIFGVVLVGGFLHSLLSRRRIYLSE